MLVHNGRIAVAVSTLALVLAQVGTAGIAAETAPSENVYTARPGLDPDELVQYIEKLQAKPKTIRTRPGFCDAIVEAADRVLAAEASDELKSTALVAKLGALHEESVHGVSEADKRLMKLVETLKEDARNNVARAVRFYALEQKVIQSSDLADSELPPVLDEVQTFMVESTLDGRHIRLASATVRLINRLQDEAEVERRFKALGELLAKSEDRTLSRYGKRLKGERELAGTAGEMVGKTLDLTGTTTGGTPFDWDSYRGKVVLVDFWATWCGPCVAEIPNVKANYDAYKEKGFDVVGISCDSDRKALEDFIKENDLGWSNIFEESQTQGQPCPLAVKYNIDAIPSTFLIDREGKIIAQNVRGEALGAHLKAIFDPPPEKKDEKPADPPPAQK